MTDPLDSMTAADWRRCYERTREWAGRYQEELYYSGRAGRRREAALVGRLRRRGDRVAQLEEENRRLRAELNTLRRAGHRATRTATGADQDTRPPSGCARCGRPERGHGRVWHEGGGQFEGYVRPSSDTILLRMRARRAERAARLQKRGSTRGAR